MPIQDLKERRATKLTEAKGIYETAKAAARDLNDDEKRRFDALEGEVRNLDGDIRREALIAEAERQADADPVDPGAGSFERELRNVSAARAMQIVLGKASGGREAEVSQEIARRNGKGPQGIFVPTQIILGEQRALLTSGSGGNLKPTDHRDDLMIDRLRPVLAIERMGATVLRDLSGDLDIPRLTASATASWVGEHAAATSSDQTFAKLSLAPKTVTAQVEYSRRMILQAAPAIEALVRADLAWILAAALDRAAIKGGGTSEPTGIMETTNVAEVSAGTPDGGPLTHELTADLIASLNIDDVMGGGRSFLTNGQVQKVAMKMKDADGHPFGVSSVFHNEPLTISSQVPSDGTEGAGTDLSAIIYGAWQHLMLAYWSGIDLLPNPYHSDVASKGGVLLHAFLDADVAVRHVEAFAFAADVDQTVATVA